MEDQWDVLMIYMRKDEKTLWCKINLSIQKNLKQSKLQMERIHRSYAYAYDWIQKFKVDG